jgi:DNA-3-methyladenine glycosylase II
MSAAHRAGTLDEASIKSASYSEVVEIITRVWGFGPWSADIVAMFYAKLPDVWPSSDAALLRGLRALVPGHDPLEVASLYSPFRTFLARHVWQGLDTGKIADLERSERAKTKL